MPPDLRRIVAAIVAQLPEGPRHTVYDFDENRHIHVTGSVAEKVALYDHDALAHVTGMRTAPYHHGLTRHFSLMQNGGSFSGYDHGSSSHYSGTATGNRVTVYDFEEGQHFHYQVT